MSACPSCGSVAKPTDKFCNTCGTPIVRQGAPQQAPYGGAPATAQPAYGAPQAAPPPQQGFGAPPAPYGNAPAAGFGAPAARGSMCQMGHEIAAGASYCAHGHPLALDAMQFSNDGYGAPQAQQPPAAYGGAPQQGYGAPMQPTGAMAGYDQQQPQAYAPPPQQPSQGSNPQMYGGAPAQQQQQQAQPYGAAPAAPFNAPQTQPPNNLYGAPNSPGFGAPTPGFDAPQPAAFGQPPPAAQPAPADRGGAPIVLPPSALRGFLITYQSNTKGDYWPLYGGRLTVGRASSGDQVDIPLADATISSRHAALVIDGAQGTVQVEDTGSTNGTFVNEEHLGFNGRRELRDGDRIRFGGFTTIVKLIGRV